MFRRRPAERPIHLRLLGIRSVKKIRHFVLNAFEFIQAQLWIAHDKDVAVFTMLVDEQTNSVGILRAHLFQHAFALEHDGKNEAGVR